MDQVWVDIILKVLVFIIVAIWGWVKAKYHLNEGRKAKAFAIAEEAVVGIYHDFVKGLKAKEPGLKLSAEDIAKARDMAWKRAKKIGKEKGFDFAKHVAKEYFPVLIDKVIKAVKK